MLKLSCNESFDLYSGQNDPRTCSRWKQACNECDVDEPSPSVIGAVVAEALAYRGVSTNRRPPPPSPFTPHLRIFASPLLFSSIISILSPRWQQTRHTACGLEGRK
jgi:hypothetical protein